MNYNQATLEAIAEMGQGVPEYNRGVLCAIGRRELVMPYQFAAVEARDLSEKLRAKLAQKHGADALSAMLDTGGEFPESEALDLANARAAEAWKPIQSLIDSAREALSVA